MLIDYADFAGFKMMPLDNTKHTYNLYEFEGPNAYPSQAFTRMLFTRKEFPEQQKSLMMPASYNLNGVDHYFDPLWEEDGVLARYDSSLPPTYKLEFSPDIISRDWFFALIFGMQNFKGKWKLEFGGHAIGGVQWKSLPMYDWYIHREDVYFRIIFETAEAAVIYKLTL